MKRYPDGIAGGHFFQKDAPEHMPDWIPTRDVPLDLSREPAEADDRLPARERRARAPLDGEHGLHRPELLVLAGRQARAARLRPLRPRPLARRRLPRDGAGRAPREGAPRRARARVLPEDERLGRDPRAPPDRAPLHVRRHARVRRDRRGRARPRAPEARDDRVVEGQAPRRPDRREPERRGEDDRVRLLGPPAGRARPSRRRFAGTR